MLPAALRPSTFTAHHGQHRRKPQLRAEIQDFQRVFYGLSHARCALSGPQGRAGGQTSVLGPAEPWNTSRQLPSIGQGPAIQGELTVMRSTCNPASRKCFSSQAGWLPAEVLVQGRFKLLFIPHAGPEQTLTLGPGQLLVGHGAPLPGSAPDATIRSRVPSKLRD